LLRPALSFAGGLAIGLPSGNLSQTKQNQVYLKVNPELLAHFLRPRHNKTVGFVQAGFALKK